MEFSVVLGAVMTGGKTTRRHHCSQIRLMILNWADVSTKPLSPSPRPLAHTITSGQSGQSQTTEVLSDIRDPFCILRFKQAPIRLAVLLVQQKTKCKLGERKKKKGGLQHFLTGVEEGKGVVGESTLGWDMHSLPFRSWRSGGGGLWGRRDELGTCSCAPKASAAQRGSVYDWDWEGLRDGHRDFKKSNLQIDSRTFIVWMFGQNVCWSKEQVCFDALKATCIFVMDQLRSASGSCGTQVCSEREREREKGAGGWQENVE